MTIPFTYRVTHLPTGTWYYGVRYADGCDPSDLWKSYYTSSTRISKLLAQDGLEAFTAEVRRTFAAKEDAIRWEHRVLRRILGLATCLNESAFPAVSPEARARGNATKRKVQATGLTIFEQAGLKWKQKKHLIDEVSGLTFGELRRRRLNEALDQNGTRFGRSGMPGDKNPAKREEVREKISKTLKDRIAKGVIVQWPTGKRLEYVSVRMRGNTITKGLVWYNDGTKDYRLSSDDPRTMGLQEGRLFCAVRGKKYQTVRCPRCDKEGAGGNMKRYHFENCKEQTPMPRWTPRQSS